MASKVGKFLEERSKIPIPSGDINRAKFFAVEMAIGVDKGYWKKNFAILDRRTWRLQGHGVEEYIKLRGFQDEFQTLLTWLYNHGYMDRLAGLTPKAFDLVEYSVQEDADNTNLNEFIRSLPELPSNDIARIRLLAKELASGVHWDLWPATIVTLPSDTVGGELVPLDTNLSEYLRERWGDSNVGRRLTLLQGHGFVNRARYDTFRVSGDAFDLLHEREAHFGEDGIVAYDTFISYRRAESSAFALLVNNTLDGHGLMPFVDMSLELGEDMHSGLKERVKQCTYFIVLIGRKTLESMWTVREISWALEFDKPFWPIWHNDFSFLRDEWPDLPDDVVEAVERRNAIVVAEESANGYRNAISEMLLKGFDIKP